MHDSRTGHLAKPNRRYTAALGVLRPSVCLSFSPYRPARHQAAGCDQPLALAMASVPILVFAAPFFFHHLFKEYGKDPTPEQGDRG